MPFWNWSKFGINPTQTHLILSTNLRNAGLPNFQGLESPRQSHEIKSVPQFVLIRNPSTFKFCVPTNEPATDFDGNGSWGHTDKRGYNRDQYPSEIPPAFDSEGRFVSAPDFTPRFRADAAGGIGRACIHLMHECTHVRHLGQSVWITDCPRARFWHAACACRASST